MKKTFGIFVTARPPRSYETGDDGFIYEAWDMDMSGQSERVLVAEVPLEVEIPEKDLRPEIVKILRKEQDGIRAEMQGKVNALEERIQSLLAIEGPKS